MNRRNFLKLAVAVGSAALLPVGASLESKPLPLIAVDPGYTWGLDMMEGYVFGVDPGPMQIYTSQDGGDTWELTPVDEIGWIASGEPSQVWTEVEV